MPGPYPPIVARCPYLLHGADYNPDQWPSKVWDDDFRLMRLARCNVMTLGVFSWAHLEPQEGKYTFGWLDTVMDKLQNNGAFGILATPSAAPPAWMSAAYPEILRVGPDGVRHRHGNRVNTCWTSPVYREKCAAMAGALAERYKDHQALGLWHLYNEYGGECHCELCQQAFREWLQAKFRSLDKLNAAYWTSFWSHDYSDWSQITAPGPPYGERSIMGLTIDWRRFTTDQVISFLRNEAQALRKHTPKIPLTTNMMGLYTGLNYTKLAEELDVAALDSYPTYHDRDGDWQQASFVSMTHDLYRTLKGGRPFMLMESTPSSTNWFDVAKLKRPGIHRLASLQAVAHGSDTVQYFQWRQSRGGAEKFHGAVVSHGGAEHTRVFSDVAEVGEILSRLDELLGSSVSPEVAVIFDWENSWALEAAQGLRRDKGYVRTVASWHRAFWKRGIPVDIPSADADLSGYRIVVAPMLYMIRPGVAERLEDFVAAGGTLVTTFLTGVVDENDLCFQGGFPGPLRRLLGVWSEEIDSLYPGETVFVSPAKDNDLGIQGNFAADTFCDLIHAEGAQVVATYASEFYADRPAVTVHKKGSGEAYYLACNATASFVDTIVAALVRRTGVATTLQAELPPGTTAQVRTDGRSDFVFVLNFTADSHVLHLDEPGLVDMLTGEGVGTTITLDAYGSRVLRRPARSKTSRAK